MLRNLFDHKYPIENLHELDLSWCIKNVQDLEAIVKKNQRVITIDCQEKNFEEAKVALKRAGMKLPVPCKIVIDKGADLIK